MQEKIKKIFQNSIHLRGTVLNETVDVERKIDDYLSNYFCKNELIGNELKEMLWNTERTTLGSKKDILFILLNRYEKTLLKEHPTFIDTLERIIPHRNIFAHLSVDYSNDVLERENVEVVFKKYNKGKLDPKVYKKEDLIKFKSDFKTINIFLDILLTSKAP